MDTTALTAAIREKTSVQDAAPIAATVNILRGTAINALGFDAEHLVLIASTRPSESVASYLYRLAKAAQDKAYSRACSSILAGEGSESDDTGDVAFWLGEGDYDTADKVLRALGVSADGAEVMQLSLTSELDMLESMRGKFSFRVEGADSRMMFFLAGQIEGGWGGLAGVGTWS